MRDLKQPRAMVTREKVIAEAGRLFALKGYHDTKLEEILDAAGVSSGAFFHHFQGKEANEDASDPFARDSTSRNSRS